MLDRSLQNGTWVLYLDEVAYRNGTWRDNVVFSADINSSSFAVGMYEFKLVVSDDLGGMDSSYINLNVTNRPPLIASPGTYVASEYGASTSLTWVVSDISTLDGNWTLWCCGQVEQYGLFTDQNATQAGSQLTILVTVDGSDARWRNVTTWPFLLEVDDGSGLSASAATLLNVTNDVFPTYPVAPVLSVDGAALTFEWGTSDPYYLTWMLADTSTSNARWQLYLNGAPWGTGGSWTGGSLVQVNVAAFCQMGPDLNVTDSIARGRNTIEFRVQDGLGQNVSLEHFVDVFNRGAEVGVTQKPHPDFWPSDPVYFRYGYNVGQPAASNITWQVTDASVGPGAVANVWCTNNEDGTKTLFPAVPFSPGTSSISVDPSGLAAGSYTFHCEADDKVPGGAIKATGGENGLATICVNAPPHVAERPAAGISYVTKSSVRLTWIVHDHFLLGLRRRKVFVWNPKWAAVLGRLWQLRGFMPKRHGLQSIRSNVPIPRPPERVGLAKWTQGELR